MPSSALILEVVSFHLGPPAKRPIERVRKTGAKTISSAITLEEAASAPLRAASEPHDCIGFMPFRCGQVVGLEPRNFQPQSRQP